MVASSLITRTAEALLRFYASQFPVVEVDSSYYGLHSSRNASLWAERTHRTASSSTSRPTGSG
jgi:uncharacterized protein YecE (DUF72 family)